ncbi:MAG: hypothetical protein HY231_21820 [Acidobacteria bacterium]|nr:hypothetical protein [Acidobacteriota bacterium]
MEKVTEGEEMMTLFRNEADDVLGEVVGFILEVEFTGKPVFSVYQKTGAGFRCLARSGDRQTASHIARTHFLFHEPDGPALAQSEIAYTEESRI